MNSIKVKDVLTKEEWDHINVLRKNMGQTKSIFSMLKTWKRIKGIVKIAEERYIKG